MKLNILLDGNYILNKSVFTLYKLRNLYTDLPIALEKEYNTLSNLFYFSKIYFISDSRGNWRKNYYSEYKGTRKKNENIDWNTVYEIYDKFKSDLNKKKNCDVLQINNLEGDDIIAYVVKETNKKGFSNMIISNDSDLFQLINYDIINKCINFMYNSKYSDERVYLPNLYNVFLENIEKDGDINDLFIGNDDIDFIEFIKNMIINKNVNDIDYEMELFIKIIGHNKDNIKSIYLKGNRGIGKIGGEKIYNFYKETYPDIIDFNSIDFKKRLIESIKYYKRIKDDIQDNDMKKRLNMNLKLVKLDKVSIPTNLYNKMQENILI